MTPTALVSLLAMLDELEHPALARLHKVLMIKLNPAPTPRASHEHELGALHAMLNAAGVITNGRPRIPRLTYDEERPAAALKSAVLVKRYGSWFKACRAASGLNLPGGTKGAPRPWASPQRNRYRGPKFTREEILTAVLRCAAYLERIPSSHAYYTWAAGERRSARQRGATLPRLPAQGSVERHFKGWGEVREAVMDRLD